MKSAGNGWQITYTIEGIMSHSNAVVRQWDVGNTSIASADKLLDLIRGASQDNVQPQAVLAIRALGSGIHPSPELIGKGVDALGGMDNVKVENLKLSLGLHSGGTTVFLRQSTPGVAAFLLISALKLWHLDDGVGVILHKMAIASGVINRWPASPQQFGNVVNAISAHAGTILPVHHLYEVGSTILGHGIDIFVQEVLYHQISSQTLAEILTWVFAGLQDADVSRMVLSGAASGSWLAAILTWIIPEKTSVSAKGRILIGPVDALLVIDLQVPSEDKCHWEFVEWKKESSIKNLISENDEIFNGQCMPRPIAKHFFQSMHGLSSKQISIMGQASGAVLSMVVERGKFSHKDTDRPEFQISLLQIASPWFCKEYESIMRRFGWSDAELQPGQMKIYEALENWQPKKECSIEGSRELISRLEEIVEDLYGPWEDASVPMAETIEWAIVNAAKALGFLTWSSIPSFLGREFLGTMVLSESDSIILVQLLQPNGTDIKNLRAALISLMLPDYSLVTGNGLIYENNGQLLYPSLILKPSCDRQTALGYVMTLGSIKKENESYSLVKDYNYQLPALEIPSNYQTPELEASLELGSLKPFNTDGEYVGLAAKSELHRVDLEVLSSVTGTEIAIKVLLKFRLNSAHHGNEVKERGARRGDKATYIEREFSWLRALENLATAIHLSREDNKMTRRGEENLARVMLSKGELDLIYWISTYSGHYLDDDNTSGKKLVARTCRDVITCLFQLSICDGVLAVVQHDCSLMNSVAIANELAQEWVIIT